MNEVYFPTVEVLCRFDDAIEKTVRVQFDPYNYADMMEMRDDAANAGRKASRKHLKDAGIEKPAQFDGATNPDLADEALKVGKRAELLFRASAIQSRIKGWSFEPAPVDLKPVTLKDYLDSGPIVFGVVESVVCGYSAGKRCAEDKKKSESPP